MTKAEECMSYVRLEAIHASKLGAVTNSFSLSMPYSSMSSVAWNKAVRNLSNYEPIVLLAEPELLGTCV